MDFLSKKIYFRIKCKIKFFIANTLPLSNLEPRPSRAFKFKRATINFLLTICVHIFLTYLLLHLYYKGITMFIFIKYICFQYLRRFQQIFYTTNLTNLLYLKNLVYRINKQLYTLHLIQLY